MRICLYIIVSFVVISCNKASERACLKGTGDNAFIEQELNEFNRMYLGPNLRFELIQDTINKLSIKGGENLVNFVKAEIVDGKLYITNENKCNFLRSYKKKILVELHLKKIQNIEFNATEPVFCQNTLLTDYLTVAISESAGRLNLHLDAQVLNTVVKSWGNFEVIGNVNFYKVSLEGNAFGNTTGLFVSDSIHVITRSGNNLEINADGVLLRSQIHSVGNIGYIGNPSIIEHTSFGEGELLNIN